MRIRSTKPEFWRSKTIAMLDWSTRLVLKGLESYVDDNGVGKDDLALIAADVFPRDLSRDPRETLARLAEAIATLAKSRLIVRYVYDGEDLLYVDRWKDLQRVDHPNKGRFPRPDGTLEYLETVNPESYGDSRETLATGTGEQGNRGTGANPSLTLVEGGPGGDPPNLPVAAKAAPTDTRGKKLPRDWRPSDETIAAMRQQFPHLDLKAIHEEFIDYWCALPGVKSRKTDWDATWRNRVREIASRQRPNGHAYSGVGKPTQKAMGYPGAAERLISEMESHD